MADIQKSFTGLPLGLLVCQPIIEVAKGQAELCRTYLEYIYSLAYKGGDVQRGEANIITFSLERPVTDTVTGEVSMKKFNVNAPLISLVPVPAFVMEETTISFTMEVKDQVVDHSKVENTDKIDITACYWGVKATISGSVTTLKEKTRTTDNSAKYEITAKARQQAPAEGMAKLTALFNSIIEPIAMTQAS